MCIAPSTLPQGLEFEDVLVCDFLSSLADNAREWRVLLTYLRSLEEHPVALEEARQMAAQAAHFGGAGSSFLQSGQWLQKQQGSSKRHMPRRLFEDVTLTAADKASLIAAQFDPHQHASLVENLKLLYVAVTRAKANVSWQQLLWQQHAVPGRLVWAPSAGACGPACINPVACVGC